MCLIASADIDLPYKSTKRLQVWLVRFIAHAPMHVIAAPVKAEHVPRWHMHAL